MWWEIALTIIKICGVVLTTVFAAYGIKNEYKRDGVLTRQGKIAIVGTSLSAALSLSAQAIESTMQYISNKQQTERYTAELTSWNKILSEVSRGLYPVNDFHVSAKLRIPLSNYAFQPYAQRLLTEFKTRNEGFDHHGFSKNVWPGRFGGFVTFESPAYPQPEKEPAASAAVRHISLWFYFFKGAVDTGPFDPTPSPDASFRAQMDPSEPATIYYDSECPGTVELSMKLTKITYFGMTERMRFLSDFSGAEVLILADEPWDVGQARLSSSQYEVGNIQISFGSKVHYLGRKVLRPLNTDWGKQYFQYTFPADMVHADTALPDTSPIPPKSTTLCPSESQDKFDQMSYGQPVISPSRCFSLRVCGY